MQDQLGGALGGSAGSGARTTGPVTAGMPVMPGMPLVTLVDTSVLSVVADVDETDVLQVKPGVRATAQLDAVPGGRYPAAVAAVDLTPTSSSRGGVSYRVRLTLGRGALAGGQPAPTPRPGMSAIVDLHVREAPNALAVASSAVLRSGGTEAVWVDEAGKARRRLVTLGAQGDDLVQVTDGLRLGDRVVVKGADGVREGQDLP